MKNRVWLFNKNTDIWLLGAPVWGCWLACFLAPASWHEQEIPLWFWVVIIVGIDVSHVWSTIFRTYLDKDEFKRHKSLLIMAPFAAVVVFFAAAAFSINTFWTILAYLALYHFIKQQYGFMRLYQARYGKVNIKKRFSDKFVIYLGMLYPVFYWHLNTQREFSWFVDGDFFNISEFTGGLTFILPYINTIGTTLYLTILVAWLLQEIVVHKKNELSFPLGKVLWIITTAFNWFLGIVYFNSDFAFSLTNVVAHGIPYMALMFFYVERKKQVTHKIPIGKMGVNVAFMLVVVLMLAFGEEYLWDMFVYRENKNLFTRLFNYPFSQVTSTLATALALALLSMPQVTHYILDGFIWKANKKNPYVKKVLLE
ncbi:MAG: hypothetical protein AAGG59_13820, partial [Bacteroidota bacterium]